MVIQLKTPQSEYTETDIRDAVAETLEAARIQARQQRDYYADLCRSLEREQGLTTGEFLARFESGQLGDDAVYFDWYAAARAYAIWERRYNILSGISV